MTTAPRALTTETDELAATISTLKSRLNELETASGSGNAPIGTIVDYIGTVAPNDWTILDGSTITNGQNLYPNLWAILPASFKSGANIVKPDTRGRVTVHQGGTLLTGAIGSTGGAETVTLSSSEIPAHNHGLNSHNHTIAHTHTYSRTTGSTVFISTTGGIGPMISTLSSTTTNTSAASTSVSGNATGDTANNTGGGGAHNNLQPYMVTVKIMKLR